MSGYETLRYEVSEDGVCSITLARPDKRNAVNDVMFRELGEATERAATDGDARAMLVRGEGTSFCAGIDLSMFSTEAFANTSNFHMFVRLAQRAYRNLQTMPKPSIAAVQGHALGAGFQLALACDLRIAAENATFGMFEVKYGIIPDLGGNRLVDSEHHERGLSRRRLAERHVGDVHARPTEDAADETDHSGPVVVADHEHVARRRHVDRVLVDHDDARLAPQARERAGDGVVAPAQRHQVDVVLGHGGLRLP